MRWRRRHRIRSGQPSDRPATSDHRAVQPLANLFWCDDWLSVPLPVGIATLRALKRNQPGAPLHPVKTAGMQRERDRDGEGLGRGLFSRLPITLASRSGVWASAGRTPGDPPARPDRPAAVPSGRPAAAEHRSAEPTTNRLATAAGSDGDLIRAAQADPAAFAALYERYVDAIYRYCASRVGSTADAEDATSQTFARAFGALPGFRARSDLNGGGVRSWLFTIAHNVVVSGYRDHRPTIPLVDAELLVDLDPTPDEQAIAAERRDTLRVAVARLSDDQRRVVELRLAGLSGPEIAAVLGRSHGAVKMLQFRAIDRLRELLADRLGAGPATEAPDDQR
jgi:RNA polymerase sigma-70 factor (ECF subfamily)